MCEREREHVSSVRAPRSPTTDVDSLFYLATMSMYRDTDEGHQKNNPQNYLTPQFAAPDTKSRCVYPAGRIWEHSHGIFVCTLFFASAGVCGMRFYLLFPGCFTIPQRSIVNIFAKDHIRSVHTRISMASDNLIHITSHSLIHGLLILHTTNLHTAGAGPRGQFSYHTTKYPYHTPLSLTLFPSLPSLLTPY